MYAAKVADLKEDGSPFGNFEFPDAKEAPAEEPLPKFEKDLKKRYHAASERVAAREARLKKIRSNPQHEGADWEALDGDEMDDLGDHLLEETALREKVHADGRSAGAAAPRLRLPLPSPRAPRALFVPRRPCPLRYGCSSTPCTAR